MHQFAFDRQALRRNQSDYGAAMQAVSLVIGQFWRWFWLALRLRPNREQAAVDPDMPLLVALVWSATRQPVTQRTFRQPQFSS